jgi:hypothetical protein
VHNVGERNLQSGPDRECRLTHEIGRRHPLQDRVHRRKNDRGLVPPAQKLRKRRHACRNHFRHRRRPVVRLAVPCRKLDHAEVGREERKTARQRVHPLCVPADHDELLRSFWPREMRARKIGRYQRDCAVRHAGNGECLLRQKGRLDEIVTRIHCGPLP